MAGDAEESDLRVCVGRQPIFDVHRKVFAYELLFRTPDSHTARIQDPDAATAQVLISTLSDIGLERIAGAEPLFLNCTRYFLEHEPVLDPQQWVLEVLEDIVVDDSLLDGIRRCRKLGYRIALDDFEYRPELAPLVELADFVKVDVLAQPMAAVEAQVKQLKRFPVRLLAEKVESEEQLLRCQSLGFELFQGYFLRKPQSVPGKRAPLNRLNTLCLLLQCQDPDVSVGKVAHVVAADVTLSYRLLQLANSALFARRAQIQSIERAITIMGTDAVFRWATLLAMTGFDDCPQSYLELALQRARMCELVAASHHFSETVSSYTAGLLSLLDSMLHRPMAEIVAPLPLSESIRGALQEPRSGEVGKVLSTVLAWEAGQTSPGNAKDNQELQEAFWEAVLYARTTLHHLQQSAERPSSMTR